MAITSGRPAGSTGTRERVAWLVVGAVWLAYLGLDLLGGPEGLRHVLKGLLMPALALWVLRAAGSAAPRLLVAGLAFATIGDIGLEFDATFLVGMAGFLVMQVLYSIGFARMGALGRIRRSWQVPVGYAAFWVAANAALGPRLGDLRIPILVYSLALCVMAALAAGVDRRVGLGGLLFLVSDMLIGVDLADLGFPGRGLVVIVTYLLAQYLIATGWVRRVRPDVFVPL